MKILTKRTEDNPLGFISLEDLSSLITDDTIINKLKELNTELELLKNKVPDINKDLVLSLIRAKNQIISFKGINITNVGSIEKKKDVYVGTMYYNSTKDCIRIKLKSGWTNL